MKKAAFLDRDGVINRDMGYVHKIKDFVILDGVLEALIALKSMGFELVVITNQSGIGRGYYSAADVDHLHSHMRNLFAQQRCELTDVLVCPHAPGDNCDCRKPKPGLINSAATRHGIDPGSSVIIGDKLTDIEAGRAGGVPRGFLVGANADARLSHGFQHVADLAEAADLLRLDVKLN